MTQSISELFVGLTDGKHELDELTPQEFEEAFLVPKYISETQLTTGKKYIVSGLRGTGKTSILRWHSIKVTEAGSIPIFILFKNLSEEKRASTSRIVGIREIVPDAGSYKILQDFKYVWTAALIARIFEEACEQKEWVSDVVPCEQFLGMLNSDTKKGRFFDLLPRLSPNFTIPIKFPDPTLPETGITLSFNAEDRKLITVDELAELAIATISKIDFKTSVYLYVDELEVFFKEKETYNRDISLVRDLIVAGSELNRLFRKKNIPVYIIIAARKEVINNLGVIGEEISKIVDDYGVEINWATDQRSADHPLIMMMDRKLSLRRDQKEQFSAVRDLIPDRICGKPWFHYMLDNTMFIPRNIVHRLNIARDKDDKRTRFDEDLFSGTEKKFSERLLRDLQLSLGAVYSDQQVRSIVTLFNGWKSEFRIDEIAPRAKAIEGYAPEIRSVVSDINRLILNLFYFGAVGNNYFNRNESKPMYIWAFRDENQPVWDEKFSIHEALKPSLNLLS